MSLKTHSFVFGAFLLNTKERVLLHDGKPLPVTPKAFLLLSILVENQGHLVEKNELISQVWPDSFVEEGNLTFTIGLLRKALGDDSHKPRFIETVPRRGYRFIAHVSDAPVEIAANRAAVGRFPTLYRHYAVVVAFCILLLFTLASGTWLAKTTLFGSASAPTILDADFRSEKFSSSGKTLHAAISPDGKLAAYIDETGGKWSVWLRKLETSENTLLVPPSDEFYFGLVFAHNGQTVYFVRKPPGGLERAASSIYRISILGGVPELIISGFIEGWISLSPDDRQISFVRSQHKADDFCSLMIIDATGQNERKILTRARSVRIGDNQFSPDGKSILFASGVSENGGNDFHLTKVNLESGVETAISSRAFFNIHSLKWMPDGETLLVSAQENLDGQSKLWEVSTITGESRPLTKDSASFRNISLNKDASRMISTQVSSNFQLYFSSQGVTKSLTHAREAVFAPDGNIVYTQDGDIWAINRDGGEQRQLTNDAYKDYSPCVSPDGRHIYFTSTRTGANQVWRMNSDGSNQTAVTKTEGGYPIFVSPAEKWVYYESGRHQTLWKVSTETGEEIQVSEHKIYHPAFSPDGNFVAFFARNNGKEKNTRITVKSLADKSIVKALDFANPQSLPVRIAWSGDNRTLNYVTWNEQGNTLWEQSLDDAQPRYLADLGTQEVEYFSLGPDYNSYIFTRGEWLHNAVIIDGLR